MYLNETYKQTKISRLCQLFDLGSPRLTRVHLDIQSSNLDPICWPRLNHFLAGSTHLCDMYLNYGYPGDDIIDLTKLFEAATWPNLLSWTSHGVDADVDAVANFIHNHPLLGILECSYPSFDCSLVDEGSFPKLRKAAAQDVHTLQNLTMIGAPKLMEISCFPCHCVGRYRSL